MKYIGDNTDFIYADCEMCKHTIDIPRSKIISKEKDRYLTEMITCDQCGNTSNKILLKKSLWERMKTQSVNAEKHKREEKQRQTQEPIRCPKCGSTQITANKKGFGLGKAVAGDLVAGAVGGLVAGSMGKNKVIITCLNCGHKWKAGKRK